MSPGDPRALGGLETNAAAAPGTPEVDGEVNHRRRPRASSRDSTPPAVRPARRRIDYTTGPTPAHRRYGYIPPPGHDPASTVDDNPTHHGEARGTEGNGAPGDNPEPPSPEGDRPTREGLEEGQEDERRRHAVVTAPRSQDCTGRVTSSIRPRPPATRTQSPGSVEELSARSSAVSRTGTAATAGARSRNRCREARA